MRESVVIQIWVATALFAALHSLLAAEAVKRFVQQRFRCSAQRYRLAYVIVALGSAAVWLGFVHSLPDRPLYAIDGVARLLLHGVQGLGVLLFVWAARSIDLGVFLGLRPPPPEGEGFAAHGAYRCCRHPMYAGALLVLFAQPVQTENHLQLSLAVALYLLLGARLEERRMLRAHPDYRAYRMQTPFLWPRWSCLQRAWRRG